MKRMHVHVVVEDLDQSVRFYSTLFCAAPTVIKGDYAKWMVDDPRVNFAISTRGDTSGVDHLGIQVEDDGALSDLARRLGDAGRAVHAQTAAKCCYARGDKAWVTDPQGVVWETFATAGEIEVYGEDGTPRMAPAGKATGS